MRAGWKPANINAGRMPALICWRSFIVDLSVGVVVEPIEPEVFQDWNSLKSLS